jgi:hypothetical protein
MIPVHALLHILARIGGFVLAFLACCALSALLTLVVMW